MSSTKQKVRGLVECGRLRQVLERGFLEPDEIDFITATVGKATKDRKKKGDER